MPKKYKYVLTLTGYYLSRINSLTKNTFPTLNHKITEADYKKIIATENKRELEKNSNNTWESADATLLSEFGDFSYHVIFESHSSLTTHSQYSGLCTLNHKVTAKTYDEDLKKFIAQFDGNEQEDDDNPELSVLSFVEIPEE